MSDLLRLSAGPRRGEGDHDTSPEAIKPTLHGWWGTAGVGRSRPRRQQARGGEPAGGGEGGGHVFAAVLLPCSLSS